MLFKRTTVPESLHSGLSTLPDRDSVNNLDLDSNQMQTRILMEIWIPIYTVDIFGMNTCTQIGIWMQWSFS